jgi:hypothetical protein
VACQGMAARPVGPSPQALVGCAARRVKASRTCTDGLEDRSPRVGHTMPTESSDAPPMRMGDCPYCERAVLVYEDPPRCPLCACPLDATSMRPFAVPGERPSDAE